MGLTKESGKACIDAAPIIACLRVIGYMRCASRDALTPGLSVLRTKVFRSLIACKTFYHQICAKTSPILLFGHAALPPRIPKQFLRGPMSWHVLWSLALIGSLFDWTLEQMVAANAPTVS